jgi:hypothetical protein
MALDEYQRWQAVRISFQSDSCKLPTGRCLILQASMQIPTAGNPQDMKVTSMRNIINIFVIFNGIPLHTTRLRLWSRQEPMETNILTEKEDGRKFRLWHGFAAWDIPTSKALCETLQLKWALTRLEGPYDSLMIVTVKYG